MWLNLSITFCILLKCCHTTLGQSYDNMTSLISTLLTGYNTYVRPVQNQSEAVTITLSMRLFSILEVDTVQGVITLVASFQASWYDERMVWNSSDHAGITSVKIQQQNVWMPPILSSQPLEFESLGEKWMHVNYQSDGNAFWSPAGVYKLSCPMNIKHWPFDQQHCELGYVIYDYNESEIKLQAGSISSVFYSENGEWSLEGHSVSTEYILGFKKVVFTIKLKRHVLFYMDTLIIPLLLLSFLSCFVFLLPNDSGERVSYCITILLSLVVFLDVISDEIPKLSNPVPSLCVFLLLGVIMSGVITILVILNLAIYHRKSSVPVGKCYKMIVWMARCKAHKISIKNDKQSKKQVPVVKFKHGEFLDEAIAGMDENNQKTYSNDSLEDDGSDITWQDVSSAFDKILFVVSLGASLVFVSTMFVILVGNL